MEYKINMKPVRISAVSYLNSVPFVSGLKGEDFAGQVELSLDNPAECAEKLLSGKVDIGLVPVAILSKIAEYQIVGDYCIGATGPVSSVMLYSEVPLTEIKTIELDYQSRTSVNLARVLTKFYWKINPTFLNAAVGYETQLTGDHAGVVIGDRTFALNNKYKYTYDLSKEWYEFTGLPFVFACWVSLKPVSKDFEQKFNLALKSGLSQIPGLAADLQKTGKFQTDILQYFTHYIQYELSDEKRKGLTTFLNYLKQL